MRSESEVSFRLALADGFLREAEQDLDLKRWRSCVDNSQLALENAGKSVLALFEVPSKTHDPSKAVSLILQDHDLPSNIQDSFQKLLKELVLLGSAEHFLTDYGDESNYTLPWDLFTIDSAKIAFDAARKSLEEARSLIAAIRDWRTRS